MMGCPVRDMSLVENENRNEMFRPLRDGRGFIGLVATERLCLTAQSFNFNRISVSILPTTARIK